MRAISLSLLIFAAVILVASAFPGVNDKGHSSRLVDPNNSQQHEKSLQRKKPPGKLPGPQLNSDDKKPKKVSLLLKPAEMKLLSPGTTQVPGPQLRTVGDNPKTAPMFGELLHPPEEKNPEFLTPDDGTNTKGALDCDKKKKEVFLMADKEKKKKEKFVPLNKSKGKNKDKDKDLVEGIAYNSGLNEDTHEQLNTAM